MGDSSNIPLSVYEDPDAQSPWKVFYEGPFFFLLWFILLFAIRTFAKPNIFDMSFVLEITVGAVIFFAALGMIELATRITRLEFTEKELLYYSTPAIVWNRGRQGRIPYDDCRIREWFYWKGRNFYSLRIKSKHSSFNISRTVWGSDNYEKVRAEIARRMPKTNYIFLELAAA
jgi:hypothetical protein